jgi:predicted nucleotidyltransferase component of viral defense system
MSVTIIQERLLSYQCKTLREQENALKEIAQEIALMTLSRAGFFQVAAFQGGTCLRILYGLERFSEDLDFVLEQPDKNFDWLHYTHLMGEEFKAYGYTLEVKNRKKSEKAMQITFFKATSEGGILVLKDERSNKPKLNIKLEIDTNPPEGSKYELRYLDFPLPYTVKAQDLSSLFAGKCHALLCREYIKGRDWYDFLWYVSQHTPINFNLLAHALAQAGPWKEQNRAVTPPWLLRELKIKMNDMDWDVAKEDVTRFLRSRELATLDLWSKDFFLSRLEKLAHLIL